MRKLKDGWPIFGEFVIETDGKRTHWVMTHCKSCDYLVSMPLTKLVANGPDMCDMCGAYQEHLR